MVNVELDIHRGLIEQSKEGVRSAQHKLYELYSKAMYNVCWRLLNNRESAEDMLQDTFADAFSKLDSFRYNSTFGAWIRQIAINKCINEINKNKNDLEYIDTYSGNDVIEDSESIDEEELSMSVMKVKKAMEQLPEGCRVIFSLYSFEGYDHQEIAQILKVSESTSKTQYMRAKQLIKELLKKWNHENW